MVYFYSGGVDPNLNDGLHYGYSVRLITDVK